MNVAAAVAVKLPPLRGDALAHAAGRPPGAAGSKPWTDARPTKEKKVPKQRSLLSSTTSVYSG